MHKLLAALALAALSLSGCAATPQVGSAAFDQGTPVAAEKRIFIIRHLQKGEGSDPSLTAEGAAGAQRLAQMLKGEGVTAVFATPTKRAMETAAPLAALLGLSVTPYDPRNAAALRAAADAASGSVLIVGHSNTVPDLVASFGGAKPAPLTEQDYGTLFAVQPDGSVTTSEVR